MVRDLLKNAAEKLSGSESPMLDARVLLAAAMKKSDAALIFEYPKEEELALFNEYIKKGPGAFPWRIYWDKRNLWDLLSVLIPIPLSPVPTQNVL